jgi:hypothetical protein
MHAIKLVMAKAKQDEYANAIKEENPLFNEFSFTEEIQKVGKK